METDSEVIILTVRIPASWKSNRKEQLTQLVYLGLSEIQDAVSAKFDGATVEL